MASCAGVMSAADLDVLVREQRANPKGDNRAAIERMVNESDGGLALLALGVMDLESQRYAGALEKFQGARLRVARIADYADMGAARALVGLERRQEAVTVFLRVARYATPVSPMRGQAALEAANALMEEQDADRAAGILKTYAKDLPQPRGSYASGLVLDRLGRQREAALELQSVYYGYPKSDEAKLAEPILTRIQTTLTLEYPPPTPAMLLGRARKLIDGGEAKQAAFELTEGLSVFSGADRDNALLRIGEARYKAREYTQAMEFLRSATLTTAAADAERLFLQLQCARRLDRTGEVDALLDKLGRQHPNSNFRAEALHGAAYRFLVANEAQSYEPLYRSCYADVPASPLAGECHWKVTWSHYLHRLPDAEQLLREQVEKFPRSEDAAAALYFMGRVADRKEKPDEARAYFEAVTSRFPNFYYAMVARERLAEAKFEGVEASAGVVASLAAVDLPKSGVGADFTMDEATRVRLDRGKLLGRAGLDEWAEFEYRYAASHGAKRPLIAIDFAQMLVRKGSPELALRIMKSYGAGYLTWHPQDAPKAFWEQIFPLHYREWLDKNAAANGLDRNVVAGLIRQESEFDAKVVSRATAVGLTQIMPLTGRDLSRRLGIAPFRTSMLADPEINLRMGTFYLKNVLNQMQGMWVAALAGYNAGPARASGWLKWNDFRDREPSEFIETIPYVETRHYVQSVLRNSDVYRRLYGPGDSQLTSTSGPEIAKPVARPKPAAAKPAARRAGTPSVSKSRASAKRTRTVQK
ncbi:MAG: transglycosylase SLT domain-containing protein [Bryobacteraceae bacterium]